jgi:hypothetical protein
MDWQVSSASTLETFYHRMSALGVMGSQVQYHTKANRGDKFPVSRQKNVLTSPARGYTVDK